MKNRIIKSSIFMSIALGGLLTFSSCKKYLDVENPSTLSEAATFSSVSNSNSAVVGIYAMLIGDNGYGNRIACLYPQSADDFKTSGDYSPTDRRGISCYGASADNTELQNPFNQLYKGIERANQCIKYIPASDLYSNGSATEKATLRKLYGEALTLRAQFYHELIRNWGDVPAQFVPASDLTNLYLPKSDKDSIYDILLNDLKVAEELVPWRSESPDQNLRLTKGAVKGLRARLALARGGYSLKSNGTSAQMTRKDDYKTYYQIAYDECKSIIESGQHGLNPVYENIFKTLHTATRLDPNYELMFEVGAYGGNASTDSKLGYYNGLRINTSAKFGGGGGGINALPTYFYEFDSLDVRRDVTVNIYEIDANSKKIAVAANALTEGKFRRSWTSITGTSQNLAINWPILRYADILLMYAEADNELNNGPSASAISALEQVRKRAFVGNESRIGNIPTDKAGFFNAIVQERLLEFGGEGIRKYDLYRWNLLGTKIDETKAKLRKFMNGEAPYANVPLYVYAKAATYNLVASSAEVNTLDLYGGTVNKVFYELGAGTSTSPASDYTAKSWRAAVNEDYITGDLKGYARYFEPNKKELLPFSTNVLNTNYNLKQNFGY